MCVRARVCLVGFIVLAGLLWSWGLPPRPRPGSGRARQTQPARSRGRAFAPSPPWDRPGRRRGYPGPRPPAHPFRTPPVLRRRRRRLPGFLFLRPTSRPAPPRPDRPGAREARLFASAWRREGNRKEEPGAGARRCIFIRAPEAAEAGAGPSGCGGQPGAGAPREWRLRSLCRPGGAGARRGSAAPPACGAAGLRAPLCYRARGPPRGRARERSRAEQPRETHHQMIITSTGLVLFPTCRHVFGPLRQATFVWV